MENGVTEVGKYRIVEQIGEGAMGVVYRALDPVLNRTVAIKVMSDALARDDELRNRFLREAQAAGSLQHPNVITIYDFGEVDGHLFIAMEFVAGIDLEEKLQKKAPLTIVEKIDILVDVLGALGYAHKRGVIHRDIKPANIRIDEEGRARIMDFGIAHLQSSTLTRTGLMVGTPAYMAPEQVTGGVVSAQTDIFSVGAVMFELFTAVKPFEGESLQSVFYKIVSQPPPDFAAMAPNAPEGLGKICMRALAKDPKVRYASAMDMASDLTEERARLDRVSSQPKALSLNTSIVHSLSASAEHAARRNTRPLPVVRERSQMQMAMAGAAGVVLLLAGGGIVMKLMSGNTDKSQTTQSSPPAAATVTTPAPVSTPASNPVTTPAAPQPQPTLTNNAKPAEKNQPHQQAKTEPAGPTAQDIALIRNAQTTALEARRRASEAGATAEQLRAGDDHSVSANTAALQGKAGDAATHFNLASSAWAAAERDARAAAAAAAAAASKSRTADAPKQDPQIPPPVVASNPPAAAQPTSPQTPATRAPAPNPAAEIDVVVRAYEQAIESRDMAELRRAYPGMTSAQAKNWEVFFNSLRSIRASLSVGGLDVRGESADARISGVYDYVTGAGKTVRQPVTFPVSFRKEGGAWRLVSIR